MVSRYQLQSLLQAVKSPNGIAYYAAPELIGPDGRASPAYLKPPDTPGRF